MRANSPNETWVAERGRSVMAKQVQTGANSLTPWERLVHCLWVADYAMRNTGRLAIARGLYADFHLEARRIAQDLSLRLTHETFSLSKRVLEQEYFNRFEAICNELKRAEPDRAPTGDQPIPSETNRTSSPADSPSLTFALAGCGKTRTKFEG